jgi:hypothetical protein
VKGAGFDLFPSHRGQFGCYYFFAMFTTDAKDDTPVSVDCKAFFGGRRESGFSVSAYPQ